MKPTVSLFLIVTVQGLCGCGGGSSSDFVTVYGKVTLGGQPVEEGNIMFVPQQLDGATGAGVIKGGAYTAEVPPGPKLVQVVARRPVPGKLDTSNPGEAVPVLEQYIPKQYNEQTTLTATVSADATQFDFELTAP